MDVLGHVPLEITTETLPAPGGAVSYLEEEEFPAGGGWRWPLKTSLNAGHITPRLYFQAIEPTK